MISTFSISLLILLNSITAAFIYGDNWLVTEEKERDILAVYTELSATNNVQLPSYEVFELGFKGYSNLKKNTAFSKNILSIADFSKASTEKRFWVIDMESGKILFHDFVAHGKNSGENYAGKFSNRPQSNMSSIGFYLTGETYTGKHGLSLYLNGMDRDYNDKARERAIVMHGADYVSEDFIRRNGRLGRSFGCLALSMETYMEIIGAISKGSCLFIYYPDAEFVKNSTVLNT